MSRCVCTQPLGMPVVPPVYFNAAGASSSGVRRVHCGGCDGCDGCGACCVPACSAGIRSSMPAGAMRGPRMLGGTGSVGAAGSMSCMLVKKSVVTEVRGSTRPAISANWSSTTSVLATLSLRSASRSCGLNSGFTGTCTAPSLRIAKNTMWYCGQFGSMTATRSPACTPWRASSAAQRSLKASSCAEGRGYWLSESWGKGWGGLRAMAAGQCRCCSSASSRSRGSCARGSSCGFMPGRPSGRRAAQLLQQLLFELVFFDFVGGRDGQRIDQADVARLHEAWHRRLRMAAHCGLVERRAARHLDEDGDLVFIAHLRRYRHGRDRAHARLPGQQCLDIEGRYVLAAHTAQAAHAVDEGVGVGSLGDLAAGVAGVDPAVALRLDGDLWLAQVLLEQQTRKARPKGELADGAGRHMVVVLIEDRDLEHRIGAPHEALGQRLVAIDQQPPGGLATGAVFGFRAPLPQCCRGSRLVAEFIDDASEARAGFGLSEAATDEVDAKA